MDTIRHLRDSDQEDNIHVEVVTLGGGCFWCLAAVFAGLKGVANVESGYSGGTVPTPTYEQVCSGTTGHAEVVQVTYDPSIITLAELLQVYFSMHDPTTRNRQGADVGTQYRSVIFYHTSEQEETARKMIADLTADGLWNDPIVTEIKPLAVFYPAEAYHQEYYQQNPERPYCQTVIAPKLSTMREKYQEKFR